MKLKRIEITKLCLLFTLSAVSISSVHAQTVVQELDSLTKDADSSIQWSSQFVGTYASSLQDTDSVDYSSSADIEATLNAVYNKTRYSLSAGASKALTGERKLMASNAYLAAARSLHKFNDHLSLNGSATATIPLSEAAKDYQRQITGFSFAPSLSYRSDFGLTLTYALKGTVNLHKYETSMSGSSNYQYNASNTLTAIYQFNSGFYIFANASYSRLFTYQGNTSDRYRFMQLVGYPIDIYDISIGHVMGGSPLAANGIENEVRFFDSRDSTIFGMLTVSF